VRERDVEDAAQEVFLVAHRKYAQFDGTSPRGWLFAISLRVAADHRKKAHVRREQPAEQSLDEGTPADQLEALERGRARELLQSILDELDEPKRAVFVLYELEELPMPEVAAILGCPAQTAYSRLHAARKYVQEAVRRTNRGKVLP
jgi:RNA polymerase sigma-70 factor (ECF subfamily)